MTTGVYCGKFIPFHRGHQHMIDVAKSQVDKLYVFVCSREDHPFEPWRRVQWIKECNPDVDVRWVDCTDLDEWDSKLWAWKFIEWLGFVPDKTFTSEHYGTAWAHYMGSEHVLVDMDRIDVPISATMVRADPYTNWQYLTAGAKSRYTKKICIVGPESCGKTVLAQNLAKHFNSVWVPEYGRIYGEQRGFGPKEWEECDGDDLFTQISLYQPIWENVATHYANRIAFCDTDLLTTKVWYRTFYEGTDKWNQVIYDLICERADRQHYDLYLLMSPTTEWVDDGLRTHGTDGMRWAMFDEIKNEIRDTAIPIIGIGDPDWDRRTKSAIDIVNAGARIWRINSFT